MTMRFHQFESGMLSLDGVDEAVFEEVATALDLSRDEVLPWRAPRAVAADCYMRPGLPVSQAGEHPPSASAEDSRGGLHERVAEVDRVFGVQSKT
jgi:hypothetical protein